MRTHGLRTRVLAAGLAVIAAALLAASATVWFAQAAGLDRHLDEVLDERIELVLDVAAEHPDPQELATALGVRGIRAVVIDTDGTSHDTETTMPLVGRNLPRPPGTLTPSLHTRTVPLPAGGEVQVAVSRDGVDATLQRLLWAQLATAVVALPLAAFLLYRTTRIALRPLDAVVDAANSIAEGDLTRRLRPADPDTEIGQVATAFDRMLDALEEAVRTSHNAERTTRRFLDTAAHQLRTPVAAAFASVQALLLAPPPDRRDDLLLAASRETDRAAKMVNDLLRLAQLDEGRPIDPLPTDLAELVEAEVARAARRAPHLSISTTGTAPLALADRDATTEIVANLLDNAARHANDRITVELGHRGPNVTIDVRDDGPGIPDDQTESIFERFVTLDGRGSTGLGLPIARELAHAQHGEVTYTGRAFRILLPRSQATA